MRQSAKDYKRIVLKVGSSLLYDHDRKLNLSFATQIVRQISEAIKDKVEVIMVSSGAISTGMSVLGISHRPKDLSSLQAAAAIGQSELINIYRRIFKDAGLNCAQILLTWEDFSDRKRYLNAKNTLLTLFKFNSVPIINENDTVSTEEIKFGDNDRLSALVATMVNADLLIILSDVDGLLDKDKKLVSLVPEINPQIKALACPTQKASCVGGMITKIEAAKIVTDSGIPCVIANGRVKEVILSVIKGENLPGTLFLPRNSRLKARQRWIAFGTKTKGKIMVDSGAKNALMNKKSLLCVGITSIEGDFRSGEIVSLEDHEKNVFARGKVSLSSRELNKVKGGRFEKEIIHRDNIVLLRQ